MKRFVIHHNMMVEYRLEHEHAGGFDDYLDVRNFVHDEDEKNPMWAVNIDLSSIIPPPVSIGEVGAVARFMRNDDELFKTKELVMNHLWECKRNEGE